MELTPLGQFRRKFKPESGSSDAEPRPKEFRLTRDEDFPAGVEI